MSLPLTCPHCQTWLLVPDNCSGQSTRCPGCLKNFVIPVAAKPVSSVGHITSSTASGKQRLKENLRHIQAEKERYTTEIASLRLDLARQAKYRHKLDRQRWWLQHFQVVRATLDYSLGRVGGFFVSLTLAGGVALIVCSLAAPPLIGYLISALLAMLVTGLAYTPFAFYPPDDHLAELVLRFTQWQAEAEIAYRQLAEAERSCQNKLDEIKSVYAGLKVAAANPNK